MKKYIYESQGVDCPECGEVTNELFNVKQNDQEVMMCDACGPINMNRSESVIRWRGWEHGGINE